MKLVSQASITVSPALPVFLMRLLDFSHTEITMYETLVRPIEVFQIPPLQPVSIVSERLKKSELKREGKRLRQIAANKAAASGKRKRDAVAADEDEVDSGNATELADSASGAGDSSSSSKRVKIGCLPMTEEDDGVPKTEEEQNTNMDIEMTVIGDPSTSASQLTEAAADISTTTNSLADIPIPTTTATAPSAKINISKALPEVRGHTSYLTFACLIPIPASAKDPSESAGSIAHW